MNDFKFNCPKCGQHILANASWIGRRLKCPSCDTRITIPPPAKPQKKEQGVAPAGGKPRALPSKLQVETPAKPEKTRGEPANELKKPEPTVTVPKIAQPKPPTDRPGAPESSEQPRVGILSAPVKLELVQAVRQRIGNESGWLPGKLDGTTAYAAKMDGGKPVLMEAKSPEATRFSLMGAFLVEMEAKRVIRTATGRKKFLDQEIPEAIREVLLEQLNDDERESSEDALAGKDLLAISHAECLATLEVLEERYSQRMEQLRIEKAKRRLGNVRLADLVNKLEKKGRILPEDVATALFHELMEVRRRLERLESRMAKNQ